MSNVIRDNTAPPSDKVADSRPYDSPATQWGKLDANALFLFWRDTLSYLRSGLLDAAAITTVPALNIVANTDPLAAPAMEAIGMNGHWFWGMDTANAPLSRDFVPVALKGTYTVTDGATTSGSATLTSASDGNFVAGLIGASISGAGIPNGTTILAVAGPTSLTMSANATASATGVHATIARNLTLDLEYWKHRGGLTPTVGFGVTPPNGLARVQVSGQDDEPAMGALRLRCTPSQTGNIFTIHDSSPADRLWVDKDFYVSGSNGGGSGAALVVAADSVNQRAVCWTGSDKATLYGFEMPVASGGLCRFRCISAGANSFDVGTDGSLRHLSTKLGFYGVATVTRQTVVALTDNTSGTANDTLQAITDPADSPATADALRDDLVANALPAIRNDLADLAAKVNALRTALVNLGLIQ